MQSKALLRKSLFATLAGVLILTTMRADVVSLYPFTGNSLASTDTNTLSTSSNIALGSGLTDATRFATVGNPTPALRVGTDETDGTTFPTAITANDFFTFTLTPTSGYRFVFQTFTADIATSATTFSTNILLQASINGGNSFVTVDSITGYTDTTFTTQSTNLTTFNNNTALAAGASVLLRIVVYDNANSADNYTAFDNLTVNATLQAIPEPGTAGLLALGSAAAAGAILCRRKR